MSADYSRNFGDQTCGDTQTDSSPAFPYLGTEISIFSGLLSDLPCSVFKDFKNCFPAVNTLIDLHN
jgi:hypothetical protein